MAITLPVQAKADTRSFDRTADIAERRFAQAGAESGKKFAKGLEDAAAKADPKAVEKWTKAYDKVADSAGKVRAEEAKLAELRDKGASNARLISQSEALQRARRAEAAATREAAKAYKDYEDAATPKGIRQAAKAAIGIGQETADNFVGGFAGASSLTRIASMAGPVGIAVSGIAALGFVAGKGFVSQLAQGMATLNMKDTFAAKLGADSATMQTYGAAAGKAFVDSWGASVEENLRVVQFAVQGGLIDTDATEADVQTLIGQIQTVTQVTGEDAQAIARGVRNMISTGLVGSTTEALDLLTQASQKGLNISQDLLDTMEEYGTKFRDLGLSGADALGLINQMWQAGIRNADVAADSIKEFAIRAVDGSKTTAEAYAALGFNASEMAGKFAAGGSAARQAFGEVLTAIRQVQDPMQQELIGVALFGTKWEDAGDAIKKADLGTAATQLGDMEGATKRASDKVSEHGNQWEALKKKIDQTFQSMREWLADTTIGRFFDQTLPKFLQGLVEGPQYPSGYSATYPGQQVSPAVPGAGGAILAPGTTGAITGNGTMLPNLITGEPGQAAPPGLTGGTGPAGAPSTRITPTPMTPDSAVSAKSPSSPSAIQLPYPADYGGPMLPGETDAQYQARMNNIAAAHSQAEAEARLNQLRASNTADANEIIAGENAVVEARMRAQQAERAYAESLTTKTTGGVAATYGEGYGLGPRAGQTASQYSAESSYFEAQQKRAQAQAEEQQMLAEGTATATELALAHNKVIEAQRNENEASLRLSESYKKSTEKLGEFGNQLDADFGLSQGLPGLAENLTKLVVGLAFAPVLGALQGVQAANGGYDKNKMGDGIIGLVATAMAPAAGTTVAALPGGAGPQVVVTPSTTSTAAPAAMPQIAAPAAAIGGLASAGTRYGLPVGTNTGGYGNPLADKVFPQWVKDLGARYGVKPSTYPGHQEGAGVNQGIDWSGSVANMQAFAEAMVAMRPPGLEQVIWQNPATQQRLGLTPGGQVVTQPGGYYRDDWGGHQDHVHTRFSQNLDTAGAALASAGVPAMGGAQSVTGSSSFGSIPLPLPVTIVGGLGGGPIPGLPTPGRAMPSTVGALGGAPSLGGLGVGAPGMGAAVPPGIGNLFGGPTGALPGPAAAGATTVGGTAPGAGPGGSGFGGIGGLPMAALQGAAASLDALAPGASIAANIGIQEVNRAIAQAGKAGGIAVGGILETLSPAGVDPTSTWFGRIAAGVAGAKPALPNMAGQSAAKPSNGAGGDLAAAQGKPVPQVTVNYTNQQATEDRAGADLTNHLMSMNTGPGW